ncbi:MAG: tetratricopeptide repeat protein [Candidatus Paracaedimonas acanthamoebae]|uniref:Tetratricopeptide repeat protein n=1 Tax=Candidatus Paracaedimonas acanthamoebae TaxID=244581 RepID=A0A8J7Q235_9PROT|nr:tetratricopeptide repeat protein [Candidatus Paracaedimonas acanthamoebae]
MPSDKLKLPQLPPEFYPEGLLVIKGIKFTPRQIDIIACLISGGTGKTISSLLDIEVKTLEAHKKSIGERIGGGIQEDIIAFVQRSPHYEFLKQHYLILLHKNEFEKQLKDLSKKFSENTPDLKVDLASTYGNKSSLLNLLVSHLKLAGIRIVSEEKEGEKSFHTLTLLPKNSGQFLEREILILLDKEVKDIPSDSIDLREGKTYFASCVEVLKKFYAESQLEKLSSSIKSEHNFTFKDDKGPNFPKEVAFSLHSKIWMFRNSLIVLSGIIILLLASAFLYQTQISSTEENAPVRPELRIPDDKVRLERPNLMKNIDKNLTSQDGIQTVTLVGMGGAGKTVLAHIYARDHSQKLSDIGRINAETKESLINSFEDFADELAKTKEKKKELKYIRNNYNLEKQKKKICSFVMRHLKLKSNWLLIYDNVENFSEIKEYFPQKSDVDAWGSGKVIITTTNDNIQNASYINPDNIIYIKELSQDESLTIFSKILYGYDSAKLIKEQKQEAINFLQNILPLPLYISVAANYMKVKKITYEEYLKRMNSCSKDFERELKDFTTETTDYDKKHYGIIAPSLEEVINLNPEFKELFFFICLLDSQSIPKELLTKYKDDLKVENFLYNLKKYSLIQEESKPVHTISFHRTIHQIAKNYLTRALHLEKQPQLYTSMANAFAEFITHAIDRADSNKMRLMVIHCEKFLSHPFLTTKIKDIVAANLGAIYYSIGDYTKSKTILENTRRSFNTYTEKPYQLLAEVLKYLGISYIKLGDPKEARTVLEEGENIYKKYPPQEKHKIADLLMFLGWAYKDLGKYEQARVTSEESKDIYEKHSPQKHHKIAFISSQIGIIYLNLGNYKKAQSFLEESLATYEKYHPTNYMDIAHIERDLGRVYGEVGHYEKAKIRFEKNLKIYEKYYPKDHIENAWPLLFLGAIHRELGEYKKAEKSLGKSFKMLKENDPRDTRIGWVSKELGALYKKLGQYNQAKKYLKESLKIFEKHYGHNHIKVGAVLRELGETHLLEGDINAAENYLNKALGIFELNNHPESYTVLEILGDLYLKKLKDAYDKKDHQQIESSRTQALNYLNEAFKIVKDYFPKDSPHIARIQEKIKNFN